jgi:hypothetical protein
MSKTHPKHPARFTLAQLSGSGKHAGEHALTQIRRLQSIDRAVVSAIIASGAVNMDDEFVYAAIEAFTTAVGARTAAETLTTAIDKDNIKAQDAIGRLAQDCSEAGYLLGLAVGLALGSGQPFGQADQLRGVPPAATR